ncbi:MAG: hypothetical protein COB83_04045 [Gammaproteobacteria bacterium]|nr:MAG: hypothetical protein COB83_04045 [Gammaproteobacteria bacterium]
MFLKNLVIALAILVVACAEKQEDAIKIGAMLPLTGDNSSYGVYCKNGMNLALEEFEKEYKLSAKIIFEDSAANPKTAVNAVNKLIKRDQVNIILGGMFSTTTMAIAPIAQENEIVLISPTAADENIPKIGKFIFSIYPSAAFEGKVMAEYLINSKSKQIGVFAQQTPVAEAIADSFIEQMNKLGKSIVFSATFPEKTKNFRNIIYTELMEKDIDALFISSYASEAGAFIRQVREYGFKGQIYSQSSLYDKKIIEDYGNFVDGVEITAPFFNSENKLNYLDEFRMKYLQKFGEEPNVWAAYGFDVASLALKSLKEAIQNKSKIEDVVLNSTLQGVTGETSFNPDRTVNKSLQIFKIENSEFIKVK